MGMPFAKLTALTIQPRLLGGDYIARFDLEFQDLLNLRNAFKSGAGVAQW